MVRIARRTYASADSSVSPRVVRPKARSSASCTRSDASAPSPVSRYA
ncbi:hypothetical protein [Jiangella alkaliphila]|nr:hypothetical protein [Jiangella alkaliphila]